MHAQFLGTAGYHPNENRHTSGIIIPDASPDDAFLLDAGTGTFRLLDIALPTNLHVFLSHAHLDHTCGLTFLFDVAWNRGLNITIYSEEKTLRAANQLFDSLLFPLTNNYNCVVISPESSIEIGGIDVSAYHLTHPGGALAFRFDWPRTSLAYVTDTAGDDRYFDFIRGTDLLIHECNFPDRLEELADASGHCTSAALVRAAKASGATQVIGTHFDPRTLTDPLEDDDVYGQINGVIAAYDGLNFEF
jgi:ribonuclease Z